MKKVFLLLTFMLSFLQMRADEGMWLMMLVKRLNGTDLQKQGLHLTPEEIYSVNNSSLKDAIVQFNGGCTAEVVSKEGLLFTNHHCGYDAIAALSTPEKNYLKDGFFAKNNKEELPAKNLYVRFLVRMDDVTARINGKLNNLMSADERNAAIAAEYKAIQKENSENGKYTVIVRDFFNGNEFYYFVYQDYKDIRLVGTPTESIGKYGGDTDNWEWPRHTGDFSVFRIYGDANGNPAEYAASNVPLKPKYHLPVSTKGIKPGDFTMIVGYPGRTNRYLTSFGINQLVTKDYVGWVDASKTAMDVMKKYMDKDTGTRLDYASQYASVANYWKNRAGTIESVNKNGTIADKQKVEAKFQEWANKPENKATYGNVLAEIEGYYKLIADRNLERSYAAQLQRNAKYTIIPYRIGSALKSYTEQDAAGKAAMKAKLTAGIESSYDGFHPVVEKDMLQTMLTLYKTKVPADNQLPTLKYSAPAELANQTTNSIFANKESVLKFIENPSKEVLENDPLYRFSGVMVSEIMIFGDKYVKADDNFAKNTRLYLDGLRKSNPDKFFYPDANSTMRLTTGKVDRLPVRKDRQYYGVKDNFYTDMKGMIAKYKKGDAEFDLPQRLIDLYNKKDFGQYKDKKGYMPVNFLSDNDITGGNSGSPILNGNGELIGLAFDGNSEALSGDIVFEKEWQKTINLDVRFLLWIMDKYHGAGYLLDEMTIRK
jgi:hypothetical protein